MFLLLTGAAQLVAHFIIFVSCRCLIIILNAFMMTKFRMITIISIMITIIKITKKITIIFIIIMTVIGMRIMIRRVIKIVKIIKNRVQKRKSIK